jgi:signal transduction histidine kinase
MNLVVDEGDEMRTSDQLQMDLLSTLSHELRSPLAVVKGYTETLLRHEQQLTEEERHEFLQTIQHASDRLENLINQLFEIAQLVNGETQLNFSTFRVVPLLQEVIEDSQQRCGSLRADRQRQCDDKEITILFLQSETVSDQTVSTLPIQGDKQRLREVIDHLLDNAILYSPHGGNIEVHCQFYGTQQTGNDTQRPQDILEARRQGYPTVEICVRDYGKGIPAQELRHIFEQFHRVDTRLTNEVSGLGLGLAICKHLVELHHGIIWLESEEEKGSTFHVLLPLASSPSPG